MGRIWSNRCFGAASRRRMLALDNYEFILIFNDMGKLPAPARPLFWVGSSRKDYRDFPPAVQDSFGFELFLAQLGQHPPSAKPLKGLTGGTVELVDDYDGDTYRAVYTVRFGTAVYVLHAFKKSKRGIKTPQSEIDLIRQRLKAAEADHASRTKQEPKK